MCGRAARGRLTTLSQDIALAGKISASPATQAVLAGMRKEKEEVQERVRSAKPFEQQAKALWERAAAIIGCLGHQSAFALLPPQVFG